MIKGSIWNVKRVALRKVSIVLFDLSLKVFIENINIIIIFFAEMIG